MNIETQNQKMSQILTRCWADAAFKVQLLADPVAVLNAQGLEVPAGVQVRVVEDTDQVVHWVIPARPNEVSDDALEAVAGGGRLGSLLSDVTASQLSSGWLGFLERYIAKPVKPVVNL